VADEGEARGTTPLGLEGFWARLPKVGAAPTLGWRAQPRWGEWHLDKGMTMPCVINQWFAHVRAGALATPGEAPG